MEESYKKTLIPDNAKYIFKRTLTIIEMGGEIKEKWMQKSAEISYFSIWTVF